MKSRSALRAADVPLGVIILLAVVLLAVIVLLVRFGAVALLRVATWGEQAAETSQRADDPLDKLRKIDPALIEYEQTGEIPVRLGEVRALAAGPDGRIYVGGAGAVHVFDPDGNRQRQIALAGPPSGLAVGGHEHAFPGRVYVAMDRHVEVFDAEGAPEMTWGDLGQQALLTSLAAAEQDVFVADAGNAVVWRYDTSGNRRGRIGERDDRRRIPGFVIPSPYFDLAVSPDGLLRVVNPGALRIEAYTFDGDLELFWGKRAPTLEGFFGCCNPAHIAVLPDGRFVTAEKGIPRVKVYSTQGEFTCVVTGPEQLDVVAADLAVDSRGRVLILDPKAASVRIFERKKTSPGPE